jgi:hypothetical protein
MPSSDWALQAHNQQYFNPSEVNKFSEQLAEALQTGGKKVTKDHVLVGGKSKRVYLGPRGGKYVKQNGKFVSIAKLGQ